MQYLKEFFNDTIINQILNNEPGIRPDEIMLPGYRMFDNKSRGIQAKSKRIEISLKHIAEKAEKNEYIYMQI